MKLKKVLMTLKKEVTVRSHHKKRKILKKAFFSEENIRKLERYKDSIKHYGKLFSD